MQSQEIIQKQIQRIIDCLKSNCSEDLKMYYFKFADSLLIKDSQQYVYNFEQESSQILAKVQQQISKVEDKNDKRSIQHCREILQSFSKNNTFAHKPEILHLLLELSKNNQQQEDNQNHTFLMKKYKDFGISNQMNLNWGSVREEQDEKIIVNNSRRNFSENMTQTKLVQELLLYFTNAINNQAIQANYELKRKLQSNPTVNNMVHQMCDLGWLHMIISKLSLKPGSIKKALRLGIQQQLKQYYFWLWKIQQKIKQKSLSLRKFYTSLFYPWQILKWLAIVLEAAQPFDGCHIISIINSFRPSGFIAVNALLSRLLAHTIKPLIRYIQNWMYMGELWDASKQYFISENHEVSIEQQWDNRFELIKQNIPNILDIQSVTKIFNAGKSLNFLRNRFNLSYVVKTEPLDLQNIQDFNLQQSKTLSETEFMKWVQKVHCEVNEVLMRTLFEQFNLHHHFASMKNFYLMGNGDFMQHLYDNLKQKLSKKQNSIDQYSLNGYIADSISKCFKDYKLPGQISNFKESVVDRLMAKKIYFGGGIQGWDYFNFEYNLDKISPLQNIFNKQINYNYCKIFNFLWKIKQIEEILKQLWTYQSRNHVQKVSKIRNRELYHILHRIYILRNSMMNFIIDLHSYIKVMIETKWTSFLLEINKATNFDEIIKIHKKFQYEILQITFQDKIEESVRTDLLNIFAVIKNFRIMYIRLQQDIQQFYYKLRISEQSMGKSKRSISSFEQSEQFETKRYIADLQQIIKNFQMAFKTVYIKLSKINENRQSNLSFLLVRLNFSQFYTNIYMS